MVQTEKNESFIRKETRKLLDIILFSWDIDTILAQYGTMLQIKKMIKLTFREDVNLDKENKEREMGLEASPSTYQFLLEVRSVVLLLWLDSKASWVTKRDGLHGC